MRDGKTLVASVLTRSVHKNLTNMTVSVVFPDIPIMRKHMAKVFSSLDTDPV